MSIGLDLTSHCFRSLRADDRKLVARNCRAEIFPVGKSSLHRQLLEQLQLTYAECDNHLLIWGEQAHRYADIFQATRLPLVIDGEVPESQPPVRQMLAYLVEGLLNSANGSGDVCGVAFARSPRALRQSTIDFFTQLISFCGYRVAAVPPSQALALAELSTCQFSGIVLHLGAAVSDFCVMHHGTVRWTQSIDLCECLPDDVNDTFQSMLLSFRCDDAEDATSSPVSSDDIILRCRVMQTVMERHFADLTSAGLFTPTSAPVPLLLGGECPRGSAVVSGLQQDVASLSAPIPISEVRWPVFGDNAVARGCLIHAELEAQKSSHRAA